MHITERSTQKYKSVDIREVDSDDYKRISVKQHLFNWRKLKDTCTIYKLTLKDEETILGLIALIDHSKEERTEIKLLASSVENIGKNKVHDRIAGCLIAFAAKEVMTKYKNYPCLSLFPKTKLKLHYITKYGMIDAGNQLFLEGVNLLKVIKEYLP